MSTIYLDMDGVVADWQQRVREILGRELEQGRRWPDRDWRRLVGFQRLYRELPLMPEAKYLVGQIKILAQQQDRDLCFLTAVPKNNDFPWAFQDKVHWANYHFPGIPVWFGPYSQDKQLRSAAGEILIDDREINIQQWQEHGGSGILYRDPAGSVLSQLEDLLNH